MYKGKFWAILLYKYAGENGHQKDLQTQICVAFALGQKRQKPVAYFFICQDGKTATQKTHKLNFCSFCFRAKATEKPF